LNSSGGDGTFFVHHTNVRKLRVSTSASTISW
jgi:hypothetical protein